MRLMPPIRRMTAALLALSPLLAAAPAHAQSQPTRYGTLSVDGDKRLMLGRRAVAPAVVGNNSLGFVELFAFADHDLVLVQDNGGEACPAQYYIIRVTRTGAVPTGPFGTCSDAVTTQRTPNGLTLSMPGFAGPMEPEAVQLRAARTPHRFIYANDRVTQLVASASNRRPRVRRPR